MIPLTLVAIFALAGQVSGTSSVSSGSSVAAPGVFEVELDALGRVVHAQAKNVPLGEVVRRLEALLKVPVKTSGSLAKSRISFARMEGVPLTELLLRLAPAPLVDMREELGQPPKLLAVHLLESQEATPPAEEAGSIVIEGTTDDTPGEGGAPGSALPGPKATAPSATSTSPDEGPFLMVQRLPDGRLNLDARDQGLGVLLFEVAQAYRARVDMRIPVAPMVSRISVNGILPSELPGVLAIPGVGVEVRRNLLTGEETVLRYIVEAAS